MKNVLLRCDSGCEIMEVIAHEEGDFAVSLYGSLFYERQTNPFLWVKDKIKAIRDFIFREHVFFEIMLNREDAERLYEFLEKELNK